MGLVGFVVELAAGVTMMLGVAAVVFLPRDQVYDSFRRPVAQTKRFVPQLSVVAAVLALNRAFRHIGQEISWAIGWNITGQIYAIEGGFVGTIQTVAFPILTVLFSVVYLHGYIVLTAFPVLAYWILDDPGPLRKLLTAYAVNYGLGLLCYTIIIAYGPRNLLPDAVSGLLYSTYPQSLLLTSTINANTNVFPSLHASLSVTAALLAYRTRDRYSGWFKVSVPLAAAVVFSTMYLGIHWATDVVAGIGLAVLSVRLADRYHRLSTVTATWAYVTGSRTRTISGSD